MTNERDPRQARPGFEADRGPRPRLLYIETDAARDENPVIDDITQKMVAAFRQAEGTGIHYRGFHMCSCGAHSTNTDYVLPSGHVTNSLAIHYLALHREEVPAEQIEIVEAFDYGIAEPNAEELNTGMQKF